MSDEKLSNHEDNKGARRSRKDEEGRDFICGCGKKYLSYPALYTHIKTKHEGHQPEGTQKTGIPSVNKRYKQKLQQKIGKQIYGMVEEEDLKLISILDSTVRGTVPFNYRIKKEYVGGVLWEAFVGLTKKNQLNLEKKIDLPTILIVYLIGVGQYVSEPMLNYYSIFAQKFSNCYFEHGEEVYDVCFKGECQSRIRSIAIDDCRFSPIISEFFLKCYLPEFGIGEEEIEIFQFLCYDFCTWLNTKRLSLVKVALNHEYKLMHKHSIEKSKIKKERKMHEKNLDQVAEDLREQPQGQSSDMLESQENQIRDMDDFENQHSEDQGDHLDYVLFGQH